MQMFKCPFHSLQAFRNLLGGETGPENESPKPSIFVLAMIPLIPSINLPKNYGSSPSASFLQQNFIGIVRADRHVTRVLQSLFI